MVRNVRRAARQGWFAALGLGMLLAQAPALAQSRPRATTATATATAADLSTALEETARVAAPAVVQIFTTSYTTGNGVVPRPTELITTERASGSGVIVDPEGYIVTNAHVVKGAERVRVDLPLPGMGRSILSSRSRTVMGRVVGLDLETDLAVVKVDEQNLTALTFGDSDALQTGQLVLAVGSPLGFNNSVTLGVVSAVARQLEPESPMIYVQTDASISPGSSGGPLLSLNGRVVGINTLVASRAVGAEGLGFAAPSNIVRTIYEQIRKSGRVRRGDIGVRPQTVTPLLASALGLARDEGVILSDVKPGSPGAKAGLRPGDLVVALDGKLMENGRQLQVSLYRRFVGDVITLDILRDGQPMKFPVAMMERDDELSQLTATDPRPHQVARLGILGVDLNAEIASSLPVVRVRSGVVVAAMVAGAIDAREGGLAPGDVIYAINRKPVSRIGDLRTIIDAFKPGEPVVLQLERRGELIYLAFAIE
jgi:serine protease Do